MTPQEEIKYLKYIVELQKQVIISQRERLEGESVTEILIKSDKDVDAIGTVDIKPYTQDFPFTPKVYCEKDSSNLLFDSGYYKKGGCKISDLKFKGK